MIDGPLRDDQALGDLGVTQPLGDQRDHVKFARGEPGGVLSRPRAWPSRHTARAPLAQPAGNDRGDRVRLQPLQLLQRAPQRLLLVRIRECERCLVGTAEIAPQRSGPPPVPGELERVRLRCLRGDLPAETSAPPPRDELTGQPTCLPVEGEPEGAGCRLGDCVTVAYKPAALGSRCRDRPTRGCGSGSSRLTTMGV